MRVRTIVPVRAWAHFSVETPARSIDACKQRRVHVLDKAVVEQAQIIAVVSSVVHESHLCTQCVACLGAQQPG
jgi:hypothetical protein